MAHIKVVVNCSYSTSPSVTPRYQGGWFNHSLVRLPFFSWIPNSLNTTKYKWMKSANDASLPRGIKFFKVLCWLNFKLAQLFRAFPKASFIMLSHWVEGHCKRNIYYCPWHTVYLPFWSSCALKNMQVCMYFGTDHISAFWLLLCYLQYIYLPKDPE